MTAETEKNKKSTYNKDEFLEKASSYRFNIKKEKEIKSKRFAAMSAIGAAAVNFVQLLEPSQENSGSGKFEKNLLSANLANDVINIKAERRRLTITILSGVGSDKNLENPRNENCGQIFCYAYLADQDTASLVARLRVYINGDITDGENTWNVDGGAEGCYPFLSDLINRCIFNLDLTWIAKEKLPTYLEYVPIVNGEIHLEHLHRTSGQYSIKPGKK